MLKKDNIINIIKKYNFKDGEYVIIAGAAMVMYGIKKHTNDIDISVTSKMFQYLLKNFNCEFETINQEKPIYFIDNIINFGENYFNKDCNYIEGLPVQKICDLVKLKKTLYRDKDIKDIERIIKFVNNDKYM